METDRLLTPRLPLLLRLAEVLRVDDLAQLTGEQKLATAAFTKPTDAQIATRFARSAVTELLHHRGNSIRAEVDDLARKLDLVG